jgi:hypothetical protein
VITSANFFFYNFDYKTLDFWVTKIEGRKAELKLQYAHHVGDDRKFSDEQIARKFRDDLMEFLKLINSAQERVMKSEKVAFNQSIVSLAFAESIKPSWINNPPKDDSQYIYGMGIGFGHDLDQTIQNAKNITRQKIGEKVLTDVSDALKQPPLSIDKADNLPTLVGKNVEKESTFKEFFVKKNEGYEVFVLGIYPRASKNL